MDGWDEHNYRLAERRYYFMMRMIQIMILMMMTSYAVVTMMISNSYDMISSAIKTIEKDKFHAA